jgi:primosomal protein N' (replication factor Y)
MYAKIVIPKTGFKSFTYNIPESLAESVRTGMPVLVSFNRQYAVGVADNTISKPDIDKELIKDILGLVDPAFALSEKQYSLLKWLSEYYICPLGDVMKAAFPPGFLGKTRTTVIAGDNVPDKPKERFIHDKVKSKSSGYKYSSSKQIIPGVSNSLIKQMIASGELYLAPDYKIQRPKVISYVYINDDIDLTLS